MEKKKVDNIDIHFSVRENNTIKIKTTDIGLILRRYKK